MRRLGRCEEEPIIATAILGTGADSALPSLLPCSNLVSRGRQEPMLQNKRLGLGMAEASVFQVGVDGWSCRYSVWDECESMGRPTNIRGKYRRKAGADPYHVQNTRIKPWS